MAQGMGNMSMLPDQNMDDATRQAMAVQFMKMGQQGGQIPNAGGAMSSFLGSMMAKNYMTNPQVSKGKLESTPQQQDALKSKFVNDITSLLKDPEMDDREKQLRLWTMKDSYANARQKQGFDPKVVRTDLADIDQLMQSFSKESTVKNKLLDLQEDALNKASQGNDADVSVDVNGNLKQKTPAERRAESKEQKQLKLNTYAARIPDYISEMRNRMGSSYDDTKALRNFERSMAEGVKLGHIDAQQYEFLVSAFIRHLKGMNNNQFDLNMSAMPTTVETE